MSVTDDQKAGVRAAIAAAMDRSNREIPHFYVIRTIDLQLMMTWLAHANMERTVTRRLLPAAVFIKAVASTLTDVPELNATWNDGRRLSSDINIGFIISLRGGGVMVPSIVHADTQSIDEIMATLNDLIPRARAMRLRSSEFGTATVTVTSLGDGGADEVLGLIYPPQVAIIGFGGIRDRPVAVDGMCTVHPTVRVSVGGDHRATDGLVANRFLSLLDQRLQDPESL